MKTRGDLKAVVKGKVRETLRAAEVDPKWYYVIKWNVNFFSANFQAQDKLTSKVAKELNRELGVRARLQSTPNGQRASYAKGVPLKKWERAAAKIKARHPHVKITQGFIKIGKVPYEESVEESVQELIASGNMMLFETAKGALKRAIQARDVKTTAMHFRKAKQALAKIPAGALSTMWAIKPEIQKAEKYISKGDGNQGIFHLKKALEQLRKGRLKL